MSDVHPGADRHFWETRLAVLERELASRPLESLSDLLRLARRWSPQLASMSELDPIPFPALPTMHSNALRGLDELAGW